MGPDVAVARDEQVFAAMLRPLFPAAYRLALALLDDHHQAEDAVQDATMSAWQSIGRLRDPAAVEAWFLKIVANRCRQVRRRSWWKVQLGDLPERGGQELEPGVIRGEDLRRALRSLNHEQRTVLALRFYLDLPLEEVAEVTGVPVGTVKSRLSRALERLRPLLSDHDEGAG